MPESDIAVAARVLVDAKLATLQSQLLALDGAQSSETKSSAGDKFETSREMMQQERDRLEAQAAVMRAHAVALEVASRAPAGQTVTRGTVVRRGDSTRYLIATGLGKICAPGGEIAWVVSPESPLGKALVGRRVGQEVQFRDHAYRC